MFRINNLCGLGYSLKKLNQKHIELFVLILNFLSDKINFIKRWVGGIYNEKEY